MKVILYTTSDCMFSKQEKEYLASKNVSFEEKNVQTNRGFLQEMLDISNNFAGTPVTKIEKDDGKSIVLKGFTQSEFDNVFASNVQAANSTIPVPPTDQPVQDQPISDQPVSDPVIPEPEVPAEPQTPPAKTPPVEPPVVETPSNPDPLPPFSTNDTPTPVQDDTTSEMHSTIPIDPSTTDVPASVPPSTPSDQPQEPAVPEATEPTPMPPVEPPPTEIPTTPQEQPSTTQDQQLNAILDSLKTKAEEATTVATT